MSTSLLATFVAVALLLGCRDFNASDAVKAEKACEEHGGWERITNPGTSVYAYICRDGEVTRDVE